jgi:hypothetical protein
MASAVQDTEHCSNHQKSRSTLYCNECGIAFCATKCIFLHKKHDFIDVKDKIKEYTKLWADLKKRVTKVKSKILAKKDVISQEIRNKFLDRANKLEQKC